MTTTPNINIPYVPEGTLDPAAGLNLALNFVDALLQTAVLAMDLTAPPGSPSDGDLYIVAGEGGSATGDWAGHDLDLARYVAEGSYWQFFEAGSEASLIINLADGNLYKYVEGSPPSWVLAAGLGDAPNDGNAYFRQSLSWIQFISPVIEETAGNSPEVSISLGALLLGREFKLTEASPSSGLLQFKGAEIVNVSDENTDATAEAFGQYRRFSHETATYTFDDAEGFEIGAEYHGRYVGEGTLTIVESGGMTINPPAGGSLVIPPQGTFTIKIVAADEADLMGLTE